MNNDKNRFVMKKLLLYAVCVVFGLSFCHAEAAKYKILYLIPFELDDYAETYARSSEDMDRVKSYQLMGFWNGAQMALDEIGSKGDTYYDVVVRDISNDETKLRNILEDRELMEDVDLIVGPFFSKMFTVAAEYAMRYRIPIVNPFTSRQDLAENNEYVYKLLPSLEARPAMIAFLAQQSDAFPIIIYGDSTSSRKEQTVYVDYFRRNQIPFEITPSASAVTSFLSNGKSRFVVTFYDNPAQNLIISRNLAACKNVSGLTFVVPETWLESKTYDIEYYSLLNLHFFSDYYVDFDAEETKTFVYDYTQRFGVPPTVQNFAFQGYDVTRYFLEFLNAENDVDRVKVTPISFQFSFDKVPGGGFENVNVQFLEVKDNEIVPSIY